MPYAPRPSRPRRFVLALVAILAVATAFVCPAFAGTYTINGTCGLWDPYDTDPGHIAVYGGCGQLVARNVGGNFSSLPNGVGGGWRFAAPPGAGISQVAISYYAR